MRVASKLPKVRNQEKRYWDKLSVPRKASKNFVIWSIPQVIVLSPYYLIQACMMLTAVTPMIFGFLPA